MISTVALLQPVLRIRISVSPSPALANKWGTRNKSGIDPQLSGHGGEVLLLRVKQESAHRHDVGRDLHETFFTLESRVVIDLVQSSHDRPKRGNRKCGLAEKGTGLVEEPNPDGRIAFLLHVQDKEQSRLSRPFLAGEREVELIGFVQSPTDAVQVLQSRTCQP